MNVDVSARRAGVICLTMTSPDGECLGIELDPLQARELADSLIDASAAAAWSPANRLINAVLPTEDEIAMMPRGEVRDALIEDGIDPDALVGELRKRLAADDAAR